MAKQRKMVRTWFPFSSVRAVPNSDKETNAHIYAEGKEVWVSDFRVNFKDGLYPQNVTAVDKEQAKLFAQNQREWQTISEATDKEVIDKGHQHTRAQFIYHCRDKATDDEKGARHRARVIAALEQGVTVPVEVLADYPDLMPA